MSEVFNPATGLLDEVGDGGAAAAIPNATISSSGLQSPAGKRIEQQSSESVQCVATAAITTLTGTTNIDGTPVNGSTALFPIAGTGTAGVNYFVGRYIYNGTTWTADPLFVVTQGAKISAIDGRTWVQTAATGAGTPVFVRAGSTITAGTNLTDADQTITQAYGQYTLFAGVRTTTRTITLNPSGAPAFVASLTVNVYDTTHTCIFLNGAAGPVLFTGILARPTALVFHWDVTNYTLATTVPLT
jgi:hypothetical protein